MYAVQNRLKAECEKGFMLTKKAKEFKEPPPPKPKAKAEDNLFAELTQGPLAAAGAKKTSTHPKFNLCACGDPDPRFKGYCENCVKKLKKKFDYLVGKFKKLKDEYEEYNQDDLGKADEKLKILKNKMAQYGAVDANMIDIIGKHEKLLNSEENRAQAEFKVQVSSMKSELKIMKAKQDMELEDLRKQQNFYDVQAVKKRGQKRDLEAEIDHLEDRAEELEAKQADVENLITLKKRFCLQMERLKEKNQEKEVW